MNCPIGTVRSRIFRAREAIAEQLRPQLDRKSARLNSSHTVIYTLSLHDALPISQLRVNCTDHELPDRHRAVANISRARGNCRAVAAAARSEERTSELQSHSDLHSFPTRRSSDLSATSKLHRS